MYRQPADAAGRQSRGYIRTVASDFCHRDFVFEVTLQLALDPAFKADQSHYIFFGIGDGVPNKNLADEVTCGLVLAFVVDNGQAFVRLCRPGAKLSHDPFDSDADNPIVAAVTPWASLGPGRHRFRMTKIGNRVFFAIDADFKGNSTPILTPPSSTCRPPRRY